MTRWIDVYEKDLPMLSRHISGLMTPEELRPLVKQGRMSEAPACGYGEPTEGSDMMKGNPANPVQNHNCRYDKRLWRIGHDVGLG